jgi:ATP-binding cassette subfamily B protein
MFTVQLFRQEKRTLEQFRGINRDHADANIRSIFYYAIFYPCVELISAVAIGLIVWYGGLRVAAGGLTLGVLIAFLQYTEQFFRPIRDLSEKYNVLQTAMASSERIFGVLDTRDAIPRPAVPEPLGELRGAVAFRDVWFAYDEKNFVLKGVSFDVEPGQTVAIVGATGAGKTSITNLLCRYYEYQRGSITVDGHDLRALDPQDLRKQMAIVMQDVFLFSTDLATNISLGNPAIDEVRLRAAAGAVGADRFIDALPKGYAEDVHERGSALSVGQKQLLAFARALAHDPRLLILDEATSSVDTENEFLIQRATEKLLEGRTAIVIAHRLSTIQRADQILVMHHGEIRERGTHAELLAHGGIYARLHKLQYRAVSNDGTNAAHVAVDSP